MKIVCVVDNISNITQKINLLKNRFGDNILYVVKNRLVPLFKTYGFAPNAIYTNNLSKVIHTLLARTELDDIVVYYTSLYINDSLLNKFISKILDKSKIVYLMPTYNIFERLCNSAYNVYVKSIFKVEDSMASPKLQFLPAYFVGELLETHFANKLFSIKDGYSTTLSVEDKDLNNQLKIKTKFNKYSLIPIIAILLITIGLILSLAYIGVNYLVVLIFTCLYLVSIVITIIFKCKQYFDARFLN
ncbi:MAG: hypothetical protein IKC49_00890 [Clostridia bacterium]|nr:hypothetical protein [Clostridia bacterium]